MCEKGALCLFMCAPQQGLGCRVDSLGPRAGSTVRVMCTCVAGSLGSGVHADLWGFGRARAGVGVTRAGVALVGAVDVCVAANGAMDGLPGSQRDEGFDVHKVEVPLAGVLKPDVVPRVD